MAYFRANCKVNLSVERLLEFEELDKKWKKLPNRQALIFCRISSE